MPLTDVQKTGLEAAILEYLTAEGGRFARTVAAFKEEAQLPDVSGGNAADNALVNDGTAMEKVWTYVHSRLIDTNGPTNRWPYTEGNVFFEAIQIGDVARVQTYVQLHTCVGIDVKSLRDEFGHNIETPLYWAAQHNQLAIVEYFVKSGHDKDEGRNDGASPLYVAAEKGHDTVVQHLVEQGADKDKAADDGTTPLFMAAQEGYVAVVQYMVQQGADKDKAANDGRTPLIAACYVGHVDVADYLLDRGCDRDHADSWSWTALHWAAQEGHLDVAQVLFRYGAKLDALTDDGETPADIAIANGHQAFADAIRAEEIRRRDHGFKRDPSTIEGTEEHEAAKRPRVEEEVVAAAAVDESDDDDDDDDDDEEE